MSFLNRILQATATLFGKDWGPGMDSQGFHVSGGLGGRSTAGENVTPETANGVSAYYACIRVISEDIAKCDLKVYDESKRGQGREVSQAKNSPEQALLKRPSPFCTAFTFYETLVSNALGWGNGYAEIVRDAGGTARYFKIHHPSKVKTEWAQDKASIYGYGIFYKVKQGNVDVPIPDSDMIHLRGPGDEMMGWSVAQIATESLGVSLAQQKFSGAFYGNGTSLGGILKFPNSLTEAQRKEIVESWKSGHQGAGKSFGTAIVPHGGSYESIAVNPKDSQMIEARQFQIEEICRWFRISPHKIQHLLRATYSNIEHQSIEHISDALYPWMERLEQELARKLLPPGSPLMFEFDPDDLLARDTPARVNLYSQAVQNGWMTPNEIRAREGLAPSTQPGADLLHIQGATVPLSAPAPASKESP